MTQSERELSALKADFRRRCNYYKPKNDTVAGNHQTVRNEIACAGQALIYACPPGRELSLALTKLEESMFWANAAIARNSGSEGGRT